MIDLISVLATDSFYVGLHGHSSLSYRPWAIMSETKYGPKLFDVYKTQEQAITAAKCFGLNKN